MEKSTEKPGDEDLAWCDAACSDPETSPSFAQWRTFEDMQGEAMQKLGGTDVRLGLLRAEIVRLVLQEDDEVILEQTLKALGGSIQDLCGESCEPVRGERALADMPKPLLQTVGPSGHPCNTKPRDDESERTTPVREYPILVAELMRDFLQERGSMTLTQLNEEILTSKWSKDAGAQALNRLARITRKPHFHASSAFGKKGTVCKSFFLSHSSMFDIKDEGEHGLVVSLKT